MEQVQYTGNVTGPDAPEPETPETEEQEVQEESQESAPEADSTESKQTGPLSFDKFHSEWSEKGELSEDSFSELEKMGIPREYVNRYIEGMAAMGDKMTRSVYESVGGEQKYQEMVGWAAENFSQDEIDAYNKAIETDPQSRTFALNSLKSRFEAARGPEPKFLGAQTKATKSGFQSSDEMVRAMSDPRYKTDPAYRADVERRVFNASF
jgi:hypothetical protein